MIVRIRTSRGAKRFTLPENATMHQLQKEIEKAYNMTPDNQILSRTPWSNPDVMEFSPSQSLASLGVKHGDLLHLLLDNRALPRGLTFGKPKEQDEKEQEEEEQAKAEQGSQNKGPKFLPYVRWMARRQQACHCLRNDEFCPACLPPELPSYQPKAGFGHLGRFSLAQMPPNAVLALQEYRHLDNLSFVNSSLLREWVQQWQRNPSVQRCALVFGTYEETPSEDTCVRAVVEALYVPPQRGGQDGVDFLDDPHEGHVQHVAAQLGLQPLAWLTTAPNRSGEKYGGKVFLSAAEVRRAARFQLQFSNANGQSRFGTVVFQKDEKTGQVEPHGYQVSDQCVAMERDHVLAAHKDPFLLSSRQGSDGEMVSRVVYKNKMLQPGEGFLPDELIVTFPVTVSSTAQPLFERHSCPSDAAPAVVLDHLRRYQSSPVHRMFSDFNLLHRCVELLGVDTVDLLCHAVHAREPLSPQDEARVRQTVQLFL